MLRDTRCVLRVLGYAFHVSCHAVSSSCHARLDPWFDRPFDMLTVLRKFKGLTTLSVVEGASKIML